MRKYRKPQTRVLSIEGEPIMTPWSQMYTGGNDCGKGPTMGNDEEPWEGL